MNKEQEQIMEDCSKDLERAVWTLIKQRMDWASLPDKAREALKADMDRADRLVLGSAVERVIASVALFARMQSAKAGEATQ